MQRFSFPILLFVFAALYSKQSECIPVGESPARYSHEYVYGLPLNVDLLNYYLEQQAEDNAVPDRETRGVAPFVRASRSSSDGLREHLFNTWIKKGRGSIRPDSNNVQLKKFIRMARGVRKIFTRVARK